MKNVENANFNPLVSIVIPVYNGSNYVREAIDSALEQTYDNIEILVVNDGSTDNTEKIVKTYGEKLRYFYKENGGVATALNLGIKEAKGEYISWLSHDDMYYPNKIENQISYLKKFKDNKKIILYSDYYVIDLVSNNSHEYVMHQNLDDSGTKTGNLKLLFKADLHGCSLLIPKECFEKVGYFDEKLKTTQDYDLWFKFIDQGYLFKYVNKTLISTRRHPMQGTLNSVDLCEYEIEELYTKAVNLFKKEINCLNYQDFQELDGFLEEKGLKKLLKNFENYGDNDTDICNPNVAKDKFNPMVSIVIPVYNGSNYVIEAINSALAQTYKNIEIIVVNDGSTDNTDKIVKSYGNKIRYFKKKNGGTSSALNLGIKNMKGQYFCWLSHDDTYYPQKTEKQIAVLSNLENKETIMMSELDGINEKYEKIYETKYIENIRQYPSRERSRIYPVLYNQTHGCTLMIPYACFQKVGMFDEKSLVAQDFEFFYRAFSKFPHKLVPEVLVTARDHSSRQGRRSKVRGSSEYSDLFISIIKRLSDRDINMVSPDKMTFYSDMKEFFNVAGYSKALKFIENNVVKNLQISSYDLIGNKFNGYDLHLNLRKNGIDSKDLVLVKESYDVNTFSYDFNAKDATKELIKKRIFYETDILHLHLVHNILDLNYLPIITALKPTILSLHDPFFLGGHCVHHFDCKKWQTHCKDCQYLNEEFVLKNDFSALNFELKKQAIQNSNIVGIVASKWMEKLVKQSPIWKGKKIYLLPFGIDHEIFKPKDVKIAKKNIGIRDMSTVLMFRADPGSFKGLDIIKRTLCELKNVENIELITVGQKGLLNEFKKKFNIIEYDWIKDDKLLASLYQACDIFLMPSRQETFGMMAVEAMSCGKMVLALDGSGTALSEVINSPVCGLAAKENNYFKELRRLINNPKEVLDRGRKSLNYAKRNYSKDIYVKKIINIYKEVIHDHKLDKSSRLILQQLRKHMVDDECIPIEPILLTESPSRYEILLKKFIPKIWRNKLRDLFIISFYKIDKIFPKTIRQYEKPKLAKLKFVRKYLIKDN